MNTTSLSDLGRKAVTNPMRLDLELLDEVTQDEFHAETNPTGKFPLCIAENLLGWPTLRDKLVEITTQKQLPDWVASYTNTLGHPDLREAFCHFLTKHLTDGQPLSPEAMAISAGATAVIETTAFLLGKPGDYAVIPAPAYSVYTADIGNKAGLLRYDLPLAHNIATYNLDTRDLDRAYADLGDKFRLLILTQPNNPTGQVFATDELLAIVDWCDAHRVHCVVNELYAFSLIDASHPNLSGHLQQSGDFTSILPHLEKRQSAYLHWWYSFSKDFGISGFRLGALYSRNEALMQAYGNYSAPVTSSNLTQWLLSELLQQDEWLTNWMANERSLSESYSLVIKVLEANGIDYAPAVGSLFVWFDLSPLLHFDSDEAWLSLWREVYEETGMLLTYPLGMMGRRGWMRLVYSCVDRPALAVAMKRFDRYLRATLQ